MTTAETSPGEPGENRAFLLSRRSFPHQGNLVSSMTQSWQFGRCRPMPSRRSQPSSKVAIEEIDPDLATLVGSFVILVVLSLIVATGQRQARGRSLSGPMAFRSCRGPPRCIVALLFSRVHRRRCIASRAHRQDERCACRFLWHPVSWRAPVRRELGGRSFHCRGDGPGALAVVNPARAQRDGPCRTLDRRLKPSRP